MTGISSYNRQLTPVYLLHTEKRGQAVLPLYLLWHFQPPSLQGKVKTNKNNCFMFPSPVQQNTGKAWLFWSTGMAWLFWSSSVSNGPTTPGPPWPL